MRSFYRMALLLGGMLAFTTCRNDQGTEPAVFAGACPISEQARVDIAQLENYTKILGLVYDRTDIAQRDSVIGIRHTEVRPRTILELHLDPTVNWVGQWLAGNPNTDNPQVNFKGSVKYR